MKTPQIAPLPGFAPLGVKRLGDSYVYGWSEIAEVFTQAETDALLRGDIVVKTGRLSTTTWVCADVLAVIAMGGLS